VRFVGPEWAYWQLRIKGAALLLVTLGIYRFWLMTSEPRPFHARVTRSLDFWPDSTKLRLVLMPFGPRDARACCPNATRELLMKLDSKTVVGLVLPAGKGDRIWFDDVLKGFGYRLRAGAGGQKLRSWVVQYRAGVVHRRYLLGSADVLIADQARTEARKVLAKIALGEDPARARGERRGKDQLTLRSIIDEFRATKTTVRRSTLHSLARYLRGPYFRPLFGTPIDRLRRRDIAARLG
jgi:hypothetical protein